MACFINPHFNDLKICIVESILIRQVVGGFTISQWDPKMKRLLATFIVATIITECSTFSSSFGSFTRAVVLLKPLEISSVNDFWAD